MKIRCSSIGKIMTNPRTKGECLSQTTKTYLEELFKELEYGYVKDFWSRYTDKGNQVEDEAILMSESLFDGMFLEKNEMKYENDYLTGTPDVITDNFIIDVKSSFNIWTFPMFADELPNKDYFYQVQGYMALTGKTDAYVIYCLINTPEDIVLDEVRRQSWEKKEISISEAVEGHVRYNHTFEIVPKDRRIKAFHVERNDVVIESIYQRIDECRKYYETLKNK
jgi:hypothetical protein